MRTSEIISNILIELDAEQSEYQKIYLKLYGKKDEQARHIYSLLCKMCERIRKEAEE